MKVTEHLKEQCEKMNIDFAFVAYSSFLTIELGKSYKPTVDQLDDLYAVLVGGALCNLGSGKTPEYMDGIGPSPEERNSLENWEKLRNELIYTLGGLAHPYEEWKKNNLISQKWTEYIIVSMDLDNQFKENPEKWCIELRESCKNKVIKDPI
jgi:hypothetical protein